MNNTVLDLHYLPSISYFSILNDSDTVFLEAQEHYNKRSYRNRCHIAGANGLQRLSIPLQKGKNRKMPIRDVRIAYDEAWQHQHWTSIISAYGNAPYFEFYSDELKPFYKKKYDFLFDFNHDLLKHLIETIGLDTTLQLTKTYEKDTTPIIDKRNTILPQNPSTSIEPYTQVFQDKYPFLTDLSVLDVLFCTGPQTVLFFEP